MAKKIVKLGHKTSEQKIYKLHYLQASDKEFIYNPRKSPLNLIRNYESFLSRSLSIICKNILFRISLDFPVSLRVGPTSIFG